MSLSGAKPLYESQLSTALEKLCEYFQPLVTDGICQS